MLPDTVDDVRQGHKGVTAGVIPFDPVEVWRTKPVKLAGRRHGWLVKGTLNKVPFEGYIGNPNANEPRHDALKLTTPSDREIRIERIFNASREMVWKAMTDPVLVAKWWGRGNKLVVGKWSPNAAATGASSSTPNKGRKVSKAATAR